MFDYALFDNLKYHFNKKYRETAKKTSLSDLIKTRSGVDVYQLADSILDELKIENIKIPVGREKETTETLEKAIEMVKKLIAIVKKTDDEIEDEKQFIKDLSELGELFKGLDPRTMHMRDEEDTLANFDKVGSKLDDMQEPKELNDILDKIELGTGNSDKPYYTVISDRDMVKKMQDEYKQGTSALVKAMAKKGYSTEHMIDYYQKALDEHKKGDIMIFINGNNKQLGKELLNTIESSGYFIATAGSFEGKIKDKTKINDYVLNNNNISISIEPNFDTKVNFEGEYLYHTTDKKNLDKVLSVGLIPKSKNTRSFYPERIYLSPNLEYMNSIKYQLNTDKPAEYVYLKIKNFDGLSLYKDVRFKGGFYTYDNIPPKYIEVIE